MAGWSERTCRVRGMKNVSGRSKRACANWQLNEKYRVNDLEMPKTAGHVIGKHLTGKVSVVRNGVKVVLTK